ncbi:ribonuclease H-like protein [Clavulina sp. PMI_390]|nr:ribonuclease H-like protein [Clavulina sp. PMI_390]
MKGVVVRGVTQRLPQGRQVLLCTASRRQKRPALPFLFRGPPAPASDRSTYHIKALHTTVPTTMNVNAPPFVPSAAPSTSATTTSTSLTPSASTMSTTPSASTSTRFSSRGQPSTRKTKPLQWADGPLVWIDCEMTGLNPRKDRLLEIAVLITNGNLDIVDPQGLNFIIQTDKAVLDTMDPWCIRQHGDSGLTNACLSSPYTLEYVRQQILEYVQSWIPNERAALLAGNSVHVDKTFLVEFMPDLVKHLHYRIVDVSTVKEICRRWYPEVTEKWTEMSKDSRHRALDDIKGSIDELKYYRSTIFKGREEVLASLTSST